VGPGLCGVTFDADGTQLATNSDDAVRVYVLPIDALMALCRSRLTRGSTPTSAPPFCKGGIDRACGGPGQERKEHL